MLGLDKTTKLEYITKKQSQNMKLTDYEIAITLLTSIALIKEHSHEGSI